PAPALPGSGSKGMISAGVAHQHPCRRGYLTSFCRKAKGGGYSPRPAPPHPALRAPLARRGDPVDLLVIGEDELAGVGDAAQLHLAARVPDAQRELVRRVAVGVPPPGALTVFAAV